MSVTSPARVLVVCTANISRSPAVERLLRLSLDDSVAVNSAGVRALRGEPIDPPVRDFLTKEGAAVDRFAARQLTEGLAREADLVLTLTREHRSQVLELAPAAVRRSYTLLEFVRVVTALDLAELHQGVTPGDRLLALVPLAAAGRALAPHPASADADDVPDPYGRGPAAYANSLELIRQATSQLASVLQGR